MAGRLARHAHLPLQSGSDAVLRRMHRRYRPWHYAGKVAELFEAAGPELTLGADVMVGFPGETEQEFAETLRFYPRAAIWLPALIPVFAAAGNAGLAIAPGCSGAGRGGERADGGAPDDPG